MKRLIIIATLLLGAFVVTASAQNGNGNGNGTKQPRNRDGQQSRNRDGRSQFDRLDLDHDGFIMANEWQKNERGFKRADINGDGRISREEWDEFQRDRRSNPKN